MSTTNPLAAMAARLQLDEAALKNIIMATIMPAKDANKQPMIVSNEMFVSFLAVANAYGLDPLKKEIYAFPAKGGGIQPVVSIDGWLSIINAHPQFNGMELQENYDTEGRFVSVTCTIYRKDRDHPVQLTEDLAECKRPTDTWSKPKRMLRHKATIQCARYAFGLGGIMEQDEAEAALDSSIVATQDGDESTARYLTHDQLNELHALLAPAGHTTESFLIAAGVPNIESLQPARFEACKRSLEARIEKRRTPPPQQHYEAIEHDYFSE
jgi:phage recombination protein Bet